MTTTLEYWGSGAPLEHTLLASCLLMVHPPDHFAPAIPTGIALAEADLSLFVRSHHQALHLVRVDPLIFDLDTPLALPTLFGPLTVHPPGLLFTVQADPFPLQEPGTALLLSNTDLRVVIHW
jgi:hypothetical protein